MKKLLLLLVAVLFSAVAYSQHTFKATVKDAKTKQPLPGASILLFNTTKGAIADSSGTAILSGIPAGKQVIVFTYIGYQKRTDTLEFPLVQSEPMI